MTVQILLPVHDIAAAPFLQNSVWVHAGTKYVQTTPDIHHTSSFRKQIHVQIHPAQSPVSTMAHIQLHMADQHLGTLV